MRPHREPSTVALTLAALTLTALTLAGAALGGASPAAAQVSVDLNALNPLGGSHLPSPPPVSPHHARHLRHHERHLARIRRAHHATPKTAVASATPHEGPGTKAGAKAGTKGGTKVGAIQHPKDLGPSFTSLPPLPGAAPPLPPPPPTLPPPAAVAKAAPAQAAPPPAPATAVPPQLALPGSPPPPPRLAETTPAPPAAAPPPPAAKTAAAPAEAPTQATAPETLPKGADSLTLPFSPQQSDLPGAENAILRNFAQRYGPGAEYIIRAFASAPAGDNDPSTPRRTSLARAQTVAAALAASGVPQKRVRLLALGDTGGKIADRVQVIAMPPASRHTASDSSP